MDKLDCSGQVQEDSCKKRVYLASPLGFSPEGRSYREKVIARLEQLGCEVFDPWAQVEVDMRIREAMGVEEPMRRAAVLHGAAYFAGHVNAEGIRSCDVVLAVLDGMEPDSGTAAEVGYGAGLGKTCYGLRTDFRDAGDLPGQPLNLQVMYFIHATDGELFRSIDKINI